MINVKSERIEYENDDQVPYSSQLRAENASAASSTSEYQPHKGRKPNQPCHNESKQSSDRKNTEFNCRLCFKKYNWKSNIYRHLRKNHGVAKPSLNDVIVRHPDESPPLRLTKGWRDHNYLLLFF